MSNFTNIAIYIGVIYSLLIIISAFIVFMYAEPGFPWHTYISLTIGYFCSFGILLLVPIDIASIVIDRRSDYNVIDNQYEYDKKTLSSAYSVFFTMILILGSVWLCLEEYYNTDGYFSSISKMINSFKRMFYDTILGVVAGCIILGVLIGQGIVSNNTAALQLSAVIVTNTIYETFLVFLLGYGLVEFPRTLWQQSNLETFLLITQMKASSDFKAISDAQLNVSLVVADVIKTKEQLAAYGDQKLNDAMKILQAECPSEFRSSRLGNVATNKSGQITIDTLANLRTRLNTLKDRYRMVQAKAERTKILAYNLEDMVAAQQSGVKTIHWSLRNVDSTESEFMWYCVYRPWVYKIGALVSAGLSILSFIGVVCSMHGVPSKHSPYFLAVHAHNATMGGIVIFIMLTLGYSVYVTMWSLFQMKLAGTMELVPERTTPESLSFNVRMVARLAAPLAFFYLGWISENGLDNGPWTQNQGSSEHLIVADVVNGTSIIVNSTVIAITNATMTFRNETIGGAISMPSAFSNFYQLQSVGIIKQTFGTLFPIILIIFVALIIPNILNRILVMCKLEKYQFGTEIITDEQLQEGKRQLQRHKKTTERHFQRGALKSRILTLAKSGESGGGVLAWLTGKSSNNENNEHGDRHGEVELPVISEPNPCAGIVEKKGSMSFGVGGGWVEMYCEMQAPGTLAFFKDKKPPSATSVPDFQYDIKLVMSFVIPDKRGKESTQLDLDFGDKIVKLRFKTVPELEKWKSSLMEWKDYAIDYADNYATSHNNNNNNNQSNSHDIEHGHTHASNATTTKNKNQYSSLLPGKGANVAAAAAASLDDIVIDEDDIEDVPVKKTTSRPFLKVFSPFKSSNKKEAVPVESSEIMPTKPATMEGWLERKGQSKVAMGGDWQRRYCRIDEHTTSLIYYKTSSLADKPAGNIDLRMASDISFYQKNGKVDKSRFNIDMGEQKYKFKAASAEEGEKWVKILNEWKDYFLLHV